MTVKTKRQPFLKLTLEPLDTLDILSLSIFLISIIINFYASHRIPRLQLINAIIVGFSSWTLIVTGTFGIRFRKAYFSAMWFMFSIIILFQNYSVSYLPLLCFMHYQIFRLIFWNKYKREFIPFSVLKNGYYPFYSKAEGRSGTNKDKSTMKWIFRLGFVLFMICLYGLVGTKIK